METNKEIELFSMNVKNCHEQSKLQEMLWRQDMLLWLTKDKERKAIINIKKNIIKSRIIEVLESKL